MLSLPLAAALFMAAASPSAAAPCRPVPGWDAVLASDSRWIVIGEIHGSREMPEMFADLVCLTGKSQPVVVALEQPAFDQAAIDEFVASDGGPAARATFLSARMWNMPMKDGRSSEAMFGLFEALRQMHGSGLVSGVVAFQPVAFDSRPTLEEYERAMAELVEMAALPGARVVALVGNVHAMRTEIRRQSAYLPMAAHLPADQTVTFNLVANGGAFWNCNAPNSCGPQPSLTPRNPHSRGVELVDGTEGPYSGALFLGTATTASPPQQGSAAAPE